MPSVVTVATSPTVSVAPPASRRRVMAAISAAVRRASPVRMRARPPMSPAGLAAIPRPMASAMAARVMSCRTRERAATSTRTEGAATPRIVARVTPPA